MTAVKKLVEFCEGLRRYWRSLALSGLIAALYWLAKLFGFATLGDFEQGLLSAYREIWAHSPFLGATILVLLLFMGAWLTWLLGHAGSAVRRSSSTTTSVGGAAGCPAGCDAPVETLMEDQLRRESFIAMLYRVLKRGCEETKTSARYIGISGLWGEGKSSVYRMLRTYECAHRQAGDPGLIFVDFNGWEVKKDFAMRLFSSVAATITNDENAGTRLRTDFKAMTDYWSAYVSLGKRLSALRHYIGSDKLLPLLKAVFTDAGQLKDDIRETLRNLTQHIVVVIDDVDRMLPDEVFELLRVLRTNGDFANMTYLILADRDQLAKMIGLAMSGPGRTGEVLGVDYLQKIIPLFIPLPKVAPDDLEDIFHTAIDNELKCHFGGRVREYDRKAMQFRYAVARVRTMRDVKQIVADLKSALYHYENAVNEVGIPGVELNDLIALLTLRHFHPSLYDVLYERYVRFRGRTMPSSQPEIMEAFGFCGAEGREEADAFWEFLLACGFFKPDAGQDLARYYSNDAQTSEQTERKWIFQGNSVEMVARFRLCSHSAFTNYFTGRSSKSSVVSRTDFESVDNAVAIGPDKAMDELRRLDSKQRLDGFLMYYLHWKDKFSREETVVLLRALVRLGDEVLAGGKQESDTIYDAVYIAFRQLLLTRVDGAEEREEIARSVFRQEETQLFVLSRFLDEMHDLESVGMSYSPQGESCVELVRLLLKRIWRDWHLSNFRFHRKADEIYECWISLAANNEHFMNGVDDGEGTGRLDGFREFVRRQISSPSEFREALRPFAQPVGRRSHGPRLLALDQVKLGRFISEEEFLEVLTDLEKKVGLPADWYAIYRRMQLWKGWTSNPNQAKGMEQFLAEHPDVASEWRVRLKKESADESRDD